jgi:hypothetical protein
MQKNKNPKTFSKESDHLEVYPERKQVSAFPERRFIKTNRMLVIIAIINLACILAGAACFAYISKKVDVRIQDSRRAYLYQINTEEKTLKPAEHLNVKEPAKKFILEKTLRDYIEVRHIGVFNMNKMEEKTKEDDPKKVEENEQAAIKDRIVRRLSSQSVYEDFSKENDALFALIFNNNIERDVHIYNLHLLHGNIWTAIVETFDFYRDRTMCRCNDNSSQCIQCKKAVHELDGRYSRLLSPTAYV